MAGIPTIPCSTRRAQTIGVDVISIGGDVLSIGDDVIHPTGNIVRKHRQA